jgi:hypothetical protein
MAIFVAMEPPDGGGDEAERMLLVRDGFAWLAFFFPPLWLLWHLLWAEALLVFALFGALSALGEVEGFGLAAPLLMVLVSIYVGLEGQALRLAALRRRGWREWGVVEADSADDADARRLLETAPADEPEPETIRPIVPDAALARSAQPGLALGLTPIPGRR